MASSSLDDVFYTDYDPANPPPLTSSRHVRFVILSDTHSTEPQGVPNGDILLHSGDLTAAGSDEEVRRQVEWLRKLPHPVKVIIAGNHDFALDADWYRQKGFRLHQFFGYPLSDPNIARDAVGKPSGQAVQATGLHYLDTEGVQIRVEREGVDHKVWKIFGSPWTPEFHGWAWNYARGEHAKQVHASIPSDTEILLTHGPPHGLGGLDRIFDGSSVGCEELTRKAMDGEIRPRLWAFGHIHEARGAHRQEWPSGNGAPSDVASHTASTGSPSTLLINAAMVDFYAEKFETSRILDYKVVSRPVIVDLSADRVQRHATATPGGSV